MKYVKLISAIILHTWKNMKDNKLDLGVDWDYLLTDPHSLELLRILGKETISFQFGVTGLCCTSHHFETCTVD